MIGEVRGSRQPPPKLLDELAFELREDGLVDVGPVVDHRAAVRAALDQVEQERSARRTWVSRGGLAAALALALGGAFALGRGSAPSRGVAGGGIEQAKVSALTLPSGDRVYTTEETELAITESYGGTSGLRLELGDALVEVAPDEGRRLRLETPTLSVDVLGTVFLASVRDGLTTVRVLDGQVRVVRGDATLELRAGEELTEGRWALPPDLVDLGRRLSDPRPQASRVEPQRGPPSFALDDGAGPPLPSREARGRWRVLTTHAARQWIVRGDAEAALRASALMLNRQAGDEGEWRFLRGDALRALGRPAEAAVAYDGAARQLPWRRAVVAGYLAAELKAHHGDVTGALATLTRTAADAPTSPLEEPALALRARLLRATGASEEAGAVAQQYLRRFPEGPAAREAEQLTLQRARVL